MAYQTRVARVNAGQVPAIVGYTVLTGQTFLDGEFVYVDTNGFLIVCAADPALIAGVVLQGAFTGPGNQLANNPTTITGQNLNASVALANGATLFQSELTNGSSTRVAPTQTDVGGIYGITAYSGVWTVDKNKTGASARVQVVAIVLPPEGGSQTGLCVYSVIAANRQFDS